MVLKLKCFSCYIPCPNAVVANSKSLTLSNLNRIPLVSPFRSIPVFLPNPKSSIYLNKISFPNFNPKLTNPGLQEFYLEIKVI